MKAIVNGRLLLPDGELWGKALVYDEKIAGITDDRDVGGAEIIDAGGAYVAPGLIDTHIHGCRGADASDGDADGLRRMAKDLLECGVTGFLPTTVTLPWDALERAFIQIRRLMPESRTPSFEGAEILGCHAEGPFINPAKKGAHAESAILPPEAERVLPFSDVIRVITFAPEMPGGEDFIRAIREKTGIVLSVGHTAATYDQARRAAALGAGRFTHLFNAMPPLRHREPGAVGAALDTDSYVELIADTLHVHPALFSPLHRAKGDRVVLVSDALRAAGMRDGEYTLGGRAFTLRAGQCRLADGTIAGSVLRLNEAVRNYREAIRAPMHAAVRAASLNAAASVGLADAKGALIPGRDADIVLMDDGCRVISTIVRGAVKYRRP